MFAVAAALAGCGGGDDSKQQRSSTPTPTPSPAPAVVGAAGADSLAVGITEPNPAFVRPGDVPEPFARWRDALAGIHPALYRLVLNWQAIQPEAGRPPDLSAANAGCMRDKPPCAGYAGVRDQLRALAARQQEGGWEALVVVLGTPAWAARPPSGCERPGTEDRNRMPRADALGAYRELVRATLAVAEEEGARLRFWSPWNEPNHPFSSSPQRAGCSGAADSVSVAPYVAVAGALRAALAEAPGEQEYVVGELAALVSRKRSTTTVGEFARALPAGLVCGAAAWSQHAYTGGADVLDDVSAALEAKGCPDTPVWITETGAGAARTRTARDGGAAGERRGCRALHHDLVRWYADPRVALAVQYTLREDDLFPTGLVTTDLARAYPALAEWQQWGMRARPRPTDPAPASAACG